MDLQDRQLEALGDINRRILLDRLRSGPLPVVELARDLPITRPAVSQHLRILKEAQLVQCESAGTRNFYRLDSRGFAALRVYFDSFWQEAMGNFAARVEGRE
jgi:DNA-binding transcriptional ArsR family regulator